VTLDTPVTRPLPDFKIPSRGGKEITLGELATDSCEEHGGDQRDGHDLEVLVRPKVSIE
jgi:hypothetical protein